jgi:AraC-like DNA-binding protein
MIGRPADLTDHRDLLPMPARSSLTTTRPAPPASIGADLLSDVLRAVRLSGAVFFNVDAAAPWVAEAPPGQVLAPHLLAGVDHVIEYHIVTAGSCWGGLIGEAPVELKAGDILVFPQGDAHVLSSAPGMRGAPAGTDNVLAEATSLPISLRLGDEGPERTRVVCGFLGCDARPFNPLMATLPRVLHVRGEADDGVLQQLVKLAMLEASQRRSGGECVLSRLSELMFIEVVRRHVASLPPEQTGWLAGLRDPLVGRALVLLHRTPEASWTLDTLAKAAAASRSVLAERFTHLVGLPPMQYLARWRMQVAAGLLAIGDLSLAEVATRVGYGSETALSHAFKRLVGVAPAVWRDGRGRAAGG